MSDKKRIYNCPVDAVLGIIGGKYKPIILYHLIDRTLRFSELRRFLPQTTAKMLTQQLRELEADGIVHREVYPVVPPRTEYSLTEFGRTLTPVLTAMCDWGKEFMGQYIRQENIGQLESRNGEEIKGRHGICDRRGAQP